MQTRAKALGHQIHPMLVTFPLGLLATGVIFDIVYLATDRHGFEIAAAYTIGAGVIGGLLAGLFGMIDAAAIPSRTRAKRIGLLHGLGNVVALVLFGISWILREQGVAWHASAVALILGFVGIVLLAGTSWLGGELVERLGVGVDPNADVNASSSLSSQHGGLTSH
ncbi:DUF2231 domain-containing protein [Rugosimonospora africana]|uniref:Membrane protein n=1 Tax=Rugosimonospora africana TaxID=556532 RepID=A0A8J3QUZ9_9ACTN|nr:DUF2231 domain-containing protein [Rugosimonospora africana]GIH17985.1 membrane protein [Rugosimonospora africana]